jgi:hypothetical protein
MGPCYYGMSLCLVADSADGLHMQRIAGNILNKQSRTADKGLYSCLGVGRRTKLLFTVNKIAFYEVLHRTSDL